jgi:hypothetical protein
MARFDGSANYEVASTTATVVIARAMPTLTLIGATFTYDATPHSASAVLAGVAGDVLPAPDVTYNGSASAPVDAGAYTIEAVYAGSANYLPAKASAQLVIEKSGTSVSASASPEPSSVGEPIILRAVIAPVAPGRGVPTGTVQFMVMGQIVGSAPVAIVNGEHVASVSIGAPPAGTYAVTASYSGDANFLASLSTPVSHVVNSRRQSTSTRLIAPPSVPIGGTVTLRAVVSTLAGSARPTGRVEFLADDISVGSAPLQFAAGEMRASLATTFATAGTRLLVARYVPDGLLAASTSNPTPIAIYDPSGPRPIVTTTTLDVPAAVRAGQAVTVTGRVQAPLRPGLLPSGSVDIYVDGIFAGRAPLVDGRLSHSIDGLSRGLHQVLAVYAGDGSFAGSTSNGYPILAF